MYAVVEEGDHYVVELALLSLKGEDIVEEKVVMRIDKTGRAADGGRFATLDQAVSVAARSLLDVADGVEALLDRLEYRLEAEERVDPLDVYNLSYLVHVLYSHSLSLRSLSVQLRSLGLLRPRTYETVRAAFRRASFLRRSLLDLRLLYLSQIQSSINVSMKRMTIVGTVALPAILISSIYGMNLSWLPLSHNPLAVFAIMIGATAIFAALVYKM